MNAAASTDTFHLFGNLITFRLTPAETGGAFFLSEAEASQGRALRPTSTSRTRLFLSFRERSSSRYRTNLPGTARGA